MISYNENYLELLKIMTSLSGLFSENKVPYLYYRNAENLFCYALNAENLSRDDSAFDALLNINGVKTGVGLKTFICEKEQKLEKIAEFNQLNKKFRYLNTDDLVFEVANARNERIDFANRLYGTKQAIYHLVARRESELRLFEENYDKIDINKIKIKKIKDSGVEFTDFIHDYNYNFSKSTLFKKFHLPDNYFTLPVEIISEPYDLLLKLKEILSIQSTKMDKKEFVILPLYSTKNGLVPERSGLNQWNANGRRRSLDEVYIPIPIQIHQNFPEFFPSRDEPFDLITPDGQILNAKVCQENSKALMTNPNSALADWLLRQLLNLKKGELATSERLQLIDCDGVIITKITDNQYKIDKAEFGSYENFINNL
ncbi:MULTISPECIES: restriction endonuclease PLD domain-containing protein [Moraxella]|nr:MULTISPECIES: restriction endonuclease PLD domain-containing protein [Moraxella]ADG62133.1 restriction endonuclease [Moraxella catarrhalis BBH18]AIT42480.1 NgoFVII restriction endonuclease [Moraxella catarrhalis]EGE11041.1 restriction endonuclease [Moraxella catarrhalis 46P47B1]EKF84577.1 restriction endonuclease [Moraxella catarrhalis RH4]MPW69972.1 NgoFVII family restriction endonuclease [Moraxella catarrhalis]